MPLFRRLAASPRTGLSPRLFISAAYGNQSGIHFEKYSSSTSCPSAGRITGIRYPKWSSPSLFTVCTSLIILNEDFCSAAHRRSECKSHCTLYYTTDVNNIWSLPPLSLYVSWHWSCTYPKDIAGECIGQTGCLCAAATL